MTVRIIVGDVFDRLAELSNESVHCIVTSPPYWGLRDYGVDGAIGLEPTFDEHLDVMGRVFREARRVLRKDGTCWMNYGDAYAGSANGRSAADTKALGNDDRTFRDKPFSTVGGVFKPKDLMMMPARVVIALQADGWWLRSEIVWAKPNPMPESVIDRPTSAHEKIYLLTKSARYFYDADAVRIPLTGGAHARRKDGERKPAKGSDPKDGRAGTWKENSRGRKMPDGWDTGPGAHGTIHRKGRENGRGNDSGQDRGANLRNVWRIAPHPFPGAHFATFPPALVAPCIKAGCPQDGVVLDPFAGSGTTGLVAERLGRDTILIELNPDYAEMARVRIKADAPMITDVA